MGMWPDLEDVQMAQNLGIDQRTAQREWRDVARVHRFLDYCWAKLSRNGLRERRMEDIRRAAELKIGRPISRIAFEIAVRLLTVRPDRFDRIRFPLLAGIDDAELKEDLAEVEGMIEGECSDIR